MLKLKRSLFTLVVASLLLSAAARAADPPETLTQRLVTDLETYSARTDCADVAAARQARESVLRILDSAKRWRRALRPHEGQFSPEQLRWLAASLAEISAMEALPRLVRAMVVVSHRVRSGSIKAGDVDVQVEPLPGSEGFVFRWRRSATGWKLHDVLHMDMSLFGEHQAELDRLIQRHGAAALVDRVSARLKRHQSRSEQCLTAR